MARVRIEVNVRMLRKKTHWSPMKVILLSGLLLYVVCLFVPMFWGIITSFKSQPDFRINIIGLPTQWKWNYTEVFERFYVDIRTDEGTRSISMIQMLINACLYAIGCAFFNTLVPCITAYLCACYPYKLSKIIYVIVIVTMILPIVGSLPSEIAVARGFGLHDHIWGLWLMKANFLGMYFLVFYNHFKSVPKTYTEAAEIDGAGHWRILCSIMMPLVQNTFFTVMLIKFIEFWNDYQTPFIYLPSHPTLALGVYFMASTTINELSTVPMRMTVAVVATIPVLALFLCFHKRLLTNLTIGGIKG